MAFPLLRMLERVWLLFWCCFGAVSVLQIVLAKSDKLCYAKRTYRRHSFCRYSREAAVGCLSGTSPEVCGWSAR